VTIAFASFVLAFNLAVFGAHAMLPFHLARAEPERRRRWALAAPVALVAAILGTMALVARRPDDAIAWGLTHPWSGSLPARLIAVVLAALVVSDLVLAVGWRRLEPAGWRLAGALGTLGVLAHAMGSELLRIGWGPSPGTAAVLLATIAFRAPLALAAGELIAGTPRWWVPISGPALILATRLWPGPLRAALADDRITLASAAFLLVIARFAPQAMRRIAAIAGLALAVLFLTRAGEVSRVLGGSLTVPGSLIEP